MKNRLKEFREAAKLSQAQLARLAEMNQVTISNVENNKAYAYPKFRKRIAKALGVKESEIFGKERTINNG